MTIEPHRIAGQFFNAPLLLTEQAGRTISSFLLSRFEARRGDASDSDSGKSFQAFQATPGADGSVEIHGARASRFVGDYRTGPDGRPTPYRVTADGTAVISIIGELVNRGAWIGASSGLVSYEGISHQITSAARDPQVRAVVLDLETPGGQATGTFELAALVRKVRASMPVVAVVNGMAASAGYAIASGATRIISLPTGLSGSIGVVMLHLDISEFLAGVGVKPTLIFAGAQKVDGNPYAPLPDDARVRFKAEVDQLYGLFVQTVAAGRRGLTDKAIRATEGRVFMGAEAARLGLVDSLGTLEDVVTALGSPRSRSSLVGGSTMIAGAALPAPSAEAAVPVKSPLVIAAETVARGAGR